MMCLCAVCCALLLRLCGRKFEYGPLMVHGGMRGHCNSKTRYITWENHVTYRQLHPCFFPNPASNHLTICTATTSSRSSKHTCSWREYGRWFSLLRKMQPVLSTLPPPGEATCSRCIHSYTTRCSVCHHDVWRRSLVNRVGSSALTLLVLEENALQPCLRTCMINSRSTSVGGSRSEITNPCGHKRSNNTYAVYLSR